MHDVRQCLSVVIPLRALFCKSITVIVHLPANFRTVKTIILLFSSLFLIIITTDAQQSVYVNYQVLGQAANTMLYDSFASRILITIPNSDAIHGNSIGIVNPLTATLTNNYFVGSDPAPMDITTNGKYAYIGMLGASQVKRFNLNSLAVDQTITLRPDPNLGPRFAQTVSCLPGSDSIIAVSEYYPGYSPGTAGVYLYDNGRVLHDSIGEYPYTISVAYFYSPSTIYGFNNVTTGFDFYTMHADSNGVRVLSDAPGLFSGFYDNFFYSGQYAVSYSGTVADLSASPSVVASFNLPQTANSACYDPYTHLACFAYSNVTSDSVYIARFNLTNFLQHDLLVLPISITGFGGVANLICWGDSTRLAFSTTDNQIVIINGIKACPVISQDFYATSMGNVFTFRDASTGTDAHATYSWTLNGFPEGDSIAFSQPMLMSSQVNTVCETVTDGCGVIGPLCKTFIYNGINDVTGADYIHLYPNPASTETTIDLGNLTAAGVELYDNMGRKIMDIKSGHEQKIPLDLSALSPGLYVVSIQIAGTSETVRKRLVVGK